MIDLRAARSDPDRYRTALARKGGADLFEQLLAADEHKRSLQTKVEDLRARTKLKGKPTPEQLEELRSIKEQLQPLEQELATADSRVRELLDRVPNPPADDTPDGDQEEDAVTVRTWGEPPSFDFPPKDHLDLAGPQGLGLIDPERAARVSGSRFHYLLGDLVRLEFALLQWGMAKMHERGFVPVIPPVLVKREAMEGTGFFPEAEAQVYALSSDELFLVGTAEVPLASMHGGELLSEEDLPLHYVGFSSCFRREAGAAGKDTRGIFRVHQFDKLELFSYCHPDRSWDEQEQLLAIEEEIAQELGFHYRVVNVAAGDLGASAARKFDIEVWLPGQERYRELTSCSNCTDYQARRLNIRFRAEGGKPRFVHMLNGTAITSSRTLLALIEYGQQADGSIAMPDALQAFGAPALISAAT